MLSPRIGATRTGWFLDMAAAFHHGIGELGFVEGQNVAIEYRWAEGDNSRLSPLAADLVRRNVAVIAAVGSEAIARVAKAARSPIGARRRCGRSYRFPRLAQAARRCAQPGPAKSAPAQRARTRPSPRR
jgi:hypothetical protein